MNEAVTGTNHTELGNFDPKNGVTITLINAIQGLPPFKCEITANKDNKPITTPSTTTNFVVKFWKAEFIGSEGISIHGGDPNKDITEFRKDDKITIGCHDVKVKDKNDGQINKINLLQNEAAFVEFTFNG